MNDDDGEHLLNRKVSDSDSQVDESDAGREQLVVDGRRQTRRRRAGPQRGGCGCGGGRRRRRRRRALAGRSVDDAEVALDVRLALVLAVERLAADAAREPAHAGVDRAMTQQRALGREALAALVTDERAV